MEVATLRRIMLGSIHEARVEDRIWRNEAEQRKVNERCAQGEVKVEKPFRLQGRERREKRVKRWESIAEQGLNHHPSSSTPESLPSEDRLLAPAYRFERWMSVMVSVSCSLANSKASTEPGWWCSGVMV